MAQNGLQDNLFKDKNLPRHVGIIMDGNRRWAFKEGKKDYMAGHEKGADVLDEIVEHAARRGVEELTVYALSTENLTGRTKSEVKDLLTLIKIVLKRKMKMMKENGVRLHFLGELKALPTSLRKLCKYSVGILKKNNRIKLNVALNYGGRDDIINAFKRMIEKGVKAKEINEELVSKNLYTGNSPDPDMIIRTGGNLRLSNFLIWQATYSELYFTDTLWPDFSPKEFDRALLEYANRKRTFGKDHALEAVSTKP